jgi:hypothetical protein
MVVVSGLTSNAVASDSFSSSGLGEVAASPGSSMPREENFIHPAKATVRIVINYEPTNCN